MVMLDQPPAPPLVALAAEQSACEPDRLLIWQAGGLRPSLRSPCTMLRIARANPTYPRKRLGEIKHINLVPAVRDAPHAHSLAPSECLQGFVL